MVLAVHVVVIGGMLLQGCKDTSKQDNSSNPPADTSSTTADNSTVTNPPAIAPAAVSNNVATQPPSLPNPVPAAPGAPIGGTSTVVTAPVAPSLPTPAPINPTPAASGGEYTIASGDTLGALAKKNGVSLKAILDANPGINPRKLHVGQKVQIPGGSGGAAMDTATAGGGSTGGMDSGDTASYTVKSGDTLSKIAKANHTSYKKLMALNDLKTTSIKVGQKLKLPVKAAPVVDSGVPASTPPTAPAVVPLQPTAPAATTAAASPSTTQQ
jgi:LysM repeat protein